MKNKELLNLSQFPSQQQKPIRKNKMFGFSSSSSNGSCNRKAIPPKLKIDTKRLEILLQLSIQRISVQITQTKAQQPAKRKQIADLLRESCSSFSSGKSIATNSDEYPHSARIHTETLIRADFLVEALQILQVYCELLHSRIPLMQLQLECDEGLLEAVCSICWAAPRLSSIPELAKVAEILTVRFGTEFYQQVLQAGENSRNEDKKHLPTASVNLRLLEKLSLRPPDSRLVEQYLEAIQCAYSVVVNANIVGEFSSTGNAIEQQQQQRDTSSTSSVKDSKLDDLMKRLESLKKQPRK
jgi:hypothetical protein